MASLRKRLRGGSLMFEIDFYAKGKRTTIPLGASYTEKTATELKGIVETLLHNYKNGILIRDKRTDAWIESASDEIRLKLGKAGLIDVPPSHTLKDVWDSFLEQKAKELKAGKIKESTFDLYDCIRRRFFRAFDPNELLGDLIQERLQTWKDHLLDEVGTATVACYIKEVKTCFTWAVSQGWIAKSPLDGIAPGSFRNKKNDHYVPMADYRRTLNAAPCKDWRCILALTRIGGLRCPTEVLNLRWEDVNWELERFYVHSPKTERHEGKEGRWVPLFPELKEELEALFFSPESEGKEFIINRYRDSSQNLRTTLEKIVLRAGLKMFPRPFDNFRASRANEVYRKWGAILEEQWIGHDPSMFKDHYWMTIDTDFQEAAEWTTPTTGAGRPKAEIKSGKKTADFGFPAIFPAAMPGNAMQTAEGQETKKSGKP